MSCPKKPRGEERLMHLERRRNSCVLKGKGHTVGKRGTDPETITDKLPDTWMAHADQGQTADCVVFQKESFSASLTPPSLSHA